MIMLGRRPYDGVPIRIDNVLVRYLRGRWRNAFNQSIEARLMKFVELLRVDPELQSGTPVVESISVECQHDLALTWLGKVPRGAAP